MEIFKAQLRLGGDLDLQLFSKRRFDMAQIYIYGDFQNVAQMWRRSIFMENYQALLRCGEDLNNDNFPIVAQIWRRSRFLMIFYTQLRCGANQDLW